MLRLRIQCLDQHCRWQYAASVDQNFFFWRQLPCKQTRGRVLCSYIIRSLTRFHRNVVSYLNSHIDIVSNRYKKLRIVRSRSPNSIAATNFEYVWHVFAVGPGEIELLIVCLFSIFIEKCLLGVSRRWTQMEYFQICAHQNELHMLRCFVCLNTD